MSEFMYAVYSFFGAAVLLVVFIALGRRFNRKLEDERRERRKQALQDYFEAKERYEKRMRN